MFNIWWNHKESKWYCVDDKVPQIHAGSKLIVICGAQLIANGKFLGVETKKLRVYDCDSSPKSLLSVTSTPIKLIDGIPRRGGIEEGAHVKLVEFLVFCPDGKIFCRLPKEQRLETYT